MAYIGVDINYGNIAKQTGTGDGSDTTPIAALTYTAPSNESILVFLDGVCQVPGTDFTATGTTLTFTTAPANGVAILVIFLGRNVDIGTPGDGTVSLAKMTANNCDSDQYVDGSVDNIHLADDAVGVDELSATGTASSSTFLRGDNAWAAAGGGAWTLIGTSVASASATLDQTGLNSTYDTYAIVVSDCVPATDGVQFWLRLGDSSGVDSGGSDYAFHDNNLLSSSSSYGGTASAGSTNITIDFNVGNASGEGIGALLYLSRPGDGTTRPIVHGTFTGIVNSGVTQGGVVTGSMLSVITLDRVQILFSSGNIASGRMSIYGIAHA